LELIEKIHKMHRDNIEVSESDRHLFYQENQICVSSIRNMKLWIKSVKLAVRKEARSRQQEHINTRANLRREIMTRLGNLHGTLRRRRQTKLDGWLNSEYQRIKCRGYKVWNLPAIPYQIAGIIYSVK
jgi:hypothetical protein